MALVKAGTDIITLCAAMHVPSPSWSQKNFREYSKLEYSGLEDTRE